MNTFRLFLSCLVAAAALLIFVPAPTSHLQIVAMFATEWGHYVSLLALALLLLPGGEASARRKIGLLMCAFAVVAGAAPVIQAYRLADSVKRSVAEVYDVEPRAWDDAPARPDPLVLKDLFVLQPTLHDVNRLTRTYSRAERALELHLYSRVRRNDRAPGVMILSGAGWRSSDPAAFARFSEYLAGRGYVVMTVGYRAGDNAPFPTDRDDVRTALNYVRSLAGTMGLDPNRIVIIGRSTGAQLALLTAYTGGVNGVVALYPFVDLRQTWESPPARLVFDARSRLGVYLGGSPDEQPRNYHDASPIDFAGLTRVPTLIIHGERDEIASATQSRILAQRLEQSGQRPVLLSLPWATHFCDTNFSGPCGQVTTYAIERFLAKVLR
jgi:acetyl esterase/lipase